MVKMKERELEGNFKTKCQLRHQIWLLVGKLLIVGGECDRL